MDKDSESSKDKKGESSGKRPGSEKRTKTPELEIHKTVKVPAKGVPEGSKFKGYKDYVTQGIQITLHNTKYRMERWLTPEGSYLEGQLPKHVHGHFDLELRRYILYQYHQCHVTSPLLLEQLHEWGVDISSGQLNNLLVEGHEGFHREKDSLLATGLEVSSYIQTDDTGARHQGKNGVCTHIGNEWFAWFASTPSKSRINFLNLLRAGREDYHIDSDAIAYMKEHKLPQRPLKLLGDHPVKSFANQAEWEEHLDALGITGKRHRQISTEGALVGSLLKHGFNPELVILSDDAGQFNVFLHALCWIHAERTIRKLTPFNESQRIALEASRQKIWDYYAKLKSYREHPSRKKWKPLEKAFDEIFQEKTCFTSLNLALRRIHKNKSELLLVLKRPEVPLHNNASESDIREYVKRRRISGSTRSDLGQKSRDTFTSLKKTVRKHGISFWNYLYDRLTQQLQIPPLADLIRNAALEASP